MRMSILKRMAKKTTTLLLVASLLFSVATSLTACGKAKGGPLDGKWSYIHDTESVALQIKNNGTATLDGVSYKCSYDDFYINLEDANGEKLSLRYYTEGEDKMYLYKISTYEYQGEGSPEGIVGMWVDTKNGRSSFEFTDNGTFCEDSYIHGYYYPDEEKGAVLFVYNDLYEDTLIYYTVDGTIMTVEYPWLMVRNK